VIIGKLTQLGRPAPGHRNCYNTSDEKYPIIGVLQQEASVDKSSEAQASFHTWLLQVVCSSITLVIRMQVLA